jgi:hypothetical protein
LHRRSTGTQTDTIKWVNKEKALAGKRKHVLLIKKISYPEHSLTLLHLNRVQAKAGTAFVETDTVRKSYCCGYKEKGRLWIRSTLQKERLAMCQIE